MRTEMVRYGRNKKNNRNSVLFTYRKDNVIFFGVSRCCGRDIFNKELGLKMARGRAEKGESLYRDRFFTSPEWQTEFNRQTLCGFVNTTEIVKLLTWFRSLND